MALQMDSSTCRQQYAERGFVAPIDVLETAAAQEARHQFDLVEATFDPAARSTGMLHLHLQHEPIWRLATHPALLDAVSAAIGPNVLLLGTHFFVKYPGQTEAFVAWHQDATYWGLDPAVAVTAWVAIDDADAENGCMRVIPGSHRRGLITHGKAQKAGNLLSVNQSLELSDEELSGAVDAELRAGQASLHDGLLIHGSNPNLSHRRRAGFTVRFTRGDVNLVSDANHKHAWKPIVVRGEASGKLGDVCPAPFPLAG